MTRMAQVAVFSMAVFALFLGTSVEAAPLPADHPQVAASASVPTPDVSRFDLNSASLKDLRSLPGIGIVKARRIVAGRPYVSVDELRTRNILPKATYEKIQDRLMVEDRKGADGAEQAEGSGHRKP